jgi:hypothetical protein
MRFGDAEKSLDPWGIGVTQGGRETDPATLQLWLKVVPIRTLYTTFRGTEAVVGKTGMGKNSAAGFVDSGSGCFCPLARLS